MMDKKSHMGIPCCYVKVYAETKSGENKFLKDGFTDISNCLDSYYSVEYGGGRTSKETGDFCG